MTGTEDPDVIRRARRVKLVIFDVDGVLTDGTLWLGPNGAEYKRFHVRDGFGIKRLGRHGIVTAVISGRRGESTAARLQELEVPHVFLGHEDKLAPFNQLVGELQLMDEEVAHVGDDYPDIPLFKRVGLAIAVRDAHPCVAPFVHWTTEQLGGHGAARNVCDLILDAHGLRPAVAAQQDAAD